MATGFQSFHPNVTFMIKMQLHCFSHSLSFLYLLQNLFSTSLSLSNSWSPLLHYCHTGTPDHTHTYTSHHTHINTHHTHISHTSHTHTHINTRNTHKFHTHTHTSRVAGFPNIALISFNYYHKIS